jgi:hypothetical protein
MSAPRDPRDPRVPLPQEEAPRPQTCGGDKLIVVGWDDDAYENIEGPCPGCPECEPAPSPSGAGAPPDDHDAFLAAQAGGFDAAKQFAAARRGASSGGAPAGDPTPTWLRSSAVWSWTRR